MGHNTGISNGTRYGNVTVERYGAQVEYGRGAHPDVQRQPHLAPHITEYPHLQTNKKRDKGNVTSNLNKFRTRRSENPPPGQLNPWKQFAGISFVIRRYTNKVCIRALNWKRIERARPCFTCTSIKIKISLVIVFLIGVGHWKRVGDTKRCRCYEITRQ